LIAQEPILERATLDDGTLSSKGAEFDSPTKQWNLQKK
jgi:hypothetical protein